MLVARWLGHALILILLATTSVAQQPQRSKQDQATQDQLEVLAAMQRLVALNQAGKYAEALPLAEQALTLARTRFGERSDTTGMAYYMLATALDNNGRHREAIDAHRRGIAIQEVTQGRESATIAMSLSNLAVSLEAVGDYVEAERAVRRALAIDEKVHGPVSRNVGIRYTTLGTISWRRAAFAEAEEFFQKALSIFERLPGAARELTGVLSNLGVVYENQGRYVDADRVLRRALAATEARAGASHPDVAVILSNLATVAAALDKPTEALAFAERGLKIHEAALGPEHPRIAIHLNNIAEIERLAGRPEKREPLLRQALAIVEKAYGKTHLDVATALSNLGAALQADGRTAEADEVFDRGIAITTALLGADTQKNAILYNNRGWSALARGQPDAAIVFFERATAILIARTEQGRDVARGDNALQRSDRDTYAFNGFVIAAYAEAEAQPSKLERLRDEAFKMAQRASGNEAGWALARMAERFSAGEGPLAVLLRQRQDAADAAAREDVKLAGLVGAAENQRKPADISAARTALAERRRVVAALDARLAREHPSFARLATPQPVSIKDVQTRLGPRETLIMHHFDREMSFVWTIAQDAVRWVKLDVTMTTLADAVAALRCGLDFAEWQRDDRGTRCSKALDGAVPRGDVLPFDLARSHALYRALLGPVQDDLAGRDLIIVPAGAFASLPPHVLVTDVPRAASNYASAAWLARSHAITVLPTPASMIALRTAAQRSPAPSAYLGVAHPVLKGTPSCPQVAMPGGCPGSAGAQLTVATRASRSAAPLARLYRDGRADVARVAELCPLPDTAVEVICVAESLGGGQTMIGPFATEAILKRLPLDQFRVVHFATHGLLADETATLMTGARREVEPALVMTPPKVASDVDDGLLTASEIAALKLNADWVVLSACNTAGGGATGGDALSGLARAFFYAGARALLVSHWAVYSDAAVALSTSAFAALREGRAATRAAALRTAMLALIDRPGGTSAHPAVWGPFVVVGDGGAVSR
jgi:CHAT domain-containing protein/Tfp pilus assembly protein PilF